MIKECAERLKAWGKEIKRGHDAAMFDALPQMLKDKIEKELNDMEQQTPQVFIVGREHSRKIGTFVFIKDPAEVIGDAIHTTADKEKAHRFTDPSEAERSANIANWYACSKLSKFTVGLPEQFRSDITASQREAHRQHRIEESLAAANELDGAKIINREELDKIFDVTENKERVEVNAIVERPAHYNQGAIDVIEALYQLLTWEQFKGFMQGNIVKYTVRFEHKDDPIIDLEKAEYYSKRLREYRNKHREAELAEKSKDWGIK